MRVIVTMGLAVLAGALAASCAEGPEYADLVPRSQELAVRFTENLANRNYHRAYRQVSEELKADMSVEQMIHRFEQVIPPDWVIFSSVDVARTLNDWADREPGDILWYEMKIPGPDYDEAITFTVIYENEELRIGDLEFGRP